MTLVLRGKEKQILGRVGDLGREADFEETGRTDEGGITGVSGGSLGDGHGCSVWAAPVPWFSAAYFRRRMVLGLAPEGILFRKTYKLNQDVIRLQRPVCAARDSCSAFRKVPCICKRISFQFCTGTGCDAT